MQHSASESNGWEKAVRVEVGEGGSGQGTAAVAQVTAEAAVLQASPGSEPWFPVGSCRSKGTLCSGLGPPEQQSAA